jgi:hypothetical protein
MYHLCLKISAVSLFPEVFSLEFSLELRVADMAEDIQGESCILASRYSTIRYAVDTRGTGVRTCPVL